MSITVTATQVAILFLLMAVGWICFRLKLFGEAANTGMTNLLLYAIVPALIIDAFHRPFDAESLNSVLISFGMSLASFAVLIAGSNLLFNKRLVPNEIRRIQVRFGAIYSNIAYVGMPVVSALLGKDGVFYGVGYLAAFNIICWTYGMATFDVERKVGLGERLRKALLNPAIIAIAGSAVIFAFSIELPGIINSALQQVAGLNAPLSMIVIGGNLAMIPLRSLASDGLAWVGMLTRNLGLPAILCGLFYFVPAPEEVKLTVLTMAACPVAAYLVMFSMLKEVDTAFPTRMMCLSTLSCVITLPAILAFGPWLWAL